MNRDWSIILLVILIIILVWLFTRRGRRDSPRLQVAIALIADVNDNLKILENHRIDPASTKKFRDRSWKAYQEKLDFMDASTSLAIKDCFTLISEVNEKIDIARRNKSPATLQELPLEKLRELLAKSKDGLVSWLRVNLQSEMRTRHGPFGF